MKNFRIVIEHIESEEEALALRNSLIKQMGLNRLVYLQIEEARHDWRTWTFK